MERHPVVGIAEAHGPVVIAVIDREETGFALPEVFFGDHPIDLLGDPSPQGVVDVLDERAGRKGDTLEFSQGGIGVLGDAAAGRFRGQAAVVIVLVVSVSGEGQAVFRVEFIGSAEEAPSGVLFPGPVAGGVVAVFFNQDAVLGVGPQAPQGIIGIGIVIGGAVHRLGFGGDSTAIIPAQGPTLGVRALHRKLLAGKFAESIEGAAQAQGAAGHRLGQSVAAIAGDGEQAAADKEPIVVIGIGFGGPGISKTGAPEVVIVDRYQRPVHGPIGIQAGEQVAVPSVVQTLVAPGDGAYPTVQIGSADGFPLRGLGLQQPDVSVGVADPLAGGIVGSGQLAILVVLIGVTVAKRGGIGREKVAVVVAEIVLVVGGIGETRIIAAQIVGKSHGGAVGPGDGGRAAHRVVGIRGGLLKWIGDRRNKTLGVKGFGGHPGALGGGSPPPPGIIAVDHILQTGFGDAGLKIGVGVEVDGRGPARAGGAHYLGIGGVSHPGPGNAVNSHGIGDALQDSPPERPPRMRIIISDFL